VRHGQQRGAEWQSVFDSLRPLVGQIWQSLPEQERRRFLRHVRPYWDVHRHRAAPEIAKFIEDQIAGGQIQLHAGRITNYQELEGSVGVKYLGRKSRKEAYLSVDRVINCTGPETDCRRLDDPLIASLLARGLARPDPLFLGLDASLDGALINLEGHVSQSIYTVGPARKGSLWESTAVPEIRQQVYKLVKHLKNKQERNGQDASGGSLTAEPLAIGNE